MELHFTNNICDKTFQEIYDAFMNGESVFANVEGVVFLLTYLYGYADTYIIVLDKQYTTDSLAGYPSYEESPGINTF